MKFDVELSVNGTTQRYQNRERQEILVWLSLNAKEIVTTAIWNKLTSDQLAEHSFQVIIKPSILLPPTIPVNEP